MPLKKGKTQEVIGENIAELTRANEGKVKKRSREQIIRIAYEMARRK